MRPLYGMTWVLQAKSSGGTSPGYGSPSFRATCEERTQRLRYHSARPPRSRTPCTMPSPSIQW